MRIRKKRTVTALAAAGLVGALVLGQAAPALAYGYWGGYRSCAFGNDALQLGSHGSGLVTHYRNGVGVAQWSNPSLTWRWNNNPISYAAYEIYASVSLTKQNSYCVIYV